MAKLFGTDGVRGVANRELTPEMVFKIGRITASLLRGENEDHRQAILVGRDTRLSGGMLEGALAAGIASTGTDVHRLGIATTPAVAFLTRRLKAIAGVVISASHNPIEDNGLKIFNRRGLKLPQRLERQIEQIYFSKSDPFPRATGPAVGQVYDNVTPVNRYLDYLKEHGPDLRGLRLVVDCGHGAACSIAPEIFSSLGATLKVIHGTPDGSRINVNCGATGPGRLGREVVQWGGDLGLAFDGDADRLIAVDERGQVVDGDTIMAICALEMVKQGKLNHNTLVVTVMSNGGLELLGQEHGFAVVRTPVGDRFVLEKMLKGGYNLGGEQSGHIIFTDYSTTGDGLFTALQLLKVVQERGSSFSELTGILPRFPQVLISRPVSSTAGWQSNEIIASEIAGLKERLGRHGQVLVRPSGTEPVIRVMLEAPLPEEELREAAQALVEIIVRELDQPARIKLDEYGG
ncbi:MAG: phosphoglucosamine mutase [Firmicutes bacterium]|nr:phosphoglucosamine mutase [Bacillota bacterium]